MQATQTVPREALNNDEQFTDPFFRRFQLRPAPAPLDLGDGLQRTYRFPTLYHDVRCAIGIFMCDFAAAKAIMPHPKLEPVRMTKGRALVIFSCYEYRHVMGVWPYNEIAMNIPVMANASFQPPILPMLLSNWFSRFGYYVFSMPVTSKENQIRGNKLWGLPKVTQRIDLDNEGEDCVVAAYDEANTNPYFRLRVPLQGTPTSFDVTGYLYSKRDGQMFKEQTNFKGEFAVRKHMAALWKKDLVPDREYLTLGDGPSAKLLRDLHIERQPFQLRYTERMNAAFDLPIAGFDIDG